MHPSKTFVPASAEAECSFMKLTTLPKVLHSLETMTHRVSVPEAVASRARVAIERMVAIGGNTPAGRELSATR
jgi:quinolinate synthase